MFFAFILSSLISVQPSFDPIERPTKEAKAKLERAVTGMELANKLQYVSGCSMFETLNNITNCYFTNPMEFLRHLIISQAYNTDGKWDSDHEFAVLDLAFPEFWHDPNMTDADRDLVRYTFEAVRPKTAIIPSQVVFKYTYKIETSHEFISGIPTFEVTDSTAGTLEITVFGGEHAQLFAVLK